MPVPDLSSLSVYKPFYEEVPEGESSFTITVPRNFGSYTNLLSNYNSNSNSNSNNSETRKREFYFSEFHLTPGFYSLRAAQLGLDTDNVNALPMEIIFRIAYTLDKNLYKLEGDREVKFDHADRAYRLDKLIKEINLYFELKKPESITQSPVFVDWVDKNWFREDQEGEEGEGDTESVYNYSIEADPDLLVPSNIDQYYDSINYAVEGSIPTNEFINALEPSVRKIQGVNNYKFPSLALLSEDALSNIRLRIHIAPLTKILISSATLLTQLGFTESQYGVRGENQKFVIPNNNTDEYVALIAENPPLNINILGTSTTIIPRLIRHNSQSDFKTISTDMVSFSDNQTLFQLLKKAFADVSSETNIQVNLQYIENQKRFKIIFPQNQRISAEIRCDVDLSERLGYGPVTKITQAMESVPVGDTNSIVDAETKSRALAFDTDMIIATLDSSSSSRTHGLEEPLLATLLPTESGTYNMKFQKAQRSVQLPTTGIGGGQYLIPVKINLWAMKKGSQKIPLDWKVSFTVGGVLEGKAPSY